jgi:ATP/maltotriose-dependent transcriptional regulator MalT
MNSILERIGVRTAAHINDPFHLIRHRMNVFLTNATANNPVTIVCAGTGCGKTRAVSDFLRSPQHNGGSDIIAFDDLHFSVDPDVIERLERILDGQICESRLILIYRNLPEALRDVVLKLSANGLTSQITETDLKFNEVELANCLGQQKITVDGQTMRDILDDTEGWAFAINLVIRSLQKNPKYEGFVRTRLKPNIFDFMESECWTALSENLKQFLVLLSMADCNYHQKVEALANSDEFRDCKDELLHELRQQHAYTRFDDQGQVLSFRRLYLEFLRTKTGAPQ